MWESGTRTGELPFGKETDRIKGTLIEGSMEMLGFVELLRAALDAGASDIFIVSGQPLS